MIRLYSYSLFCRVVHEPCDMQATKYCWKLWKIKGNYIQLITADDSFFPVNNNMAQYATHACFRHSHEFLLMLRLQHQHSHCSMFTLCLKTSSHPQVIVYNNLRHSTQQNKKNNKKVEIFLPFALCVIFSIYFIHFFIQIFYKQAWFNSLGGFGLPHQAISISF